MIIFMRNSIKDDRSKTKCRAIRNVSHVEHFTDRVEFSLEGGDCEEIDIVDGDFEREGKKYDFLTTYDGSAEAGLREEFPKCVWEEMPAYITAPVPG